MTLRYYATGSYLLTLADFAGISESSASRFVGIVTEAIAVKLGQTIHMPDEEEQATVVREFFNIARCPSVVGAIDCTHVKLNLPVSDATLKIRNLVARWPGSAHDKTIFANSRLKVQLENGDCGDGLIVGDSGYSNQDYLITPLLNPETEPSTMSLKYERETLWVSRMLNRDEKLKIVMDSVRSYPDFPQPGVIFRDIFSVLGNPTATGALYEIIKEDCQPLSKKISAVCGLDSRGFLFGPQIAAQFQVPFVPVRKKGKLPGKTVSAKFDLEYGSDEFEVQTDFLNGANILLVDDLLATGGSLKAAGSLVESLGCTIEKCLVIMELEGLNGRAAIPYSVHSILQF